MVDTENTGKVECIVEAASKDAEFVGVQVISGRLALDDFLVCVETGRRYQIVSVGLASTPEAYDAGNLILHLAVADDNSGAKSALERGMHLVRG